MKLFHFYQSTAAWRIRIALNYKKIPCELVNVDLLKREHLSQAFLSQHKDGRVPALDDDGFLVGQSSAILEYLEEKFPTPSLLPHDPKSRAWVRYLAQIVISDMHPIMNNSSVVRYLREELKLNEDQITHWYHTWLKQGFDSLESNLNDSQNRVFCFGDTPTFADVCLIPQVYNAYRFHFPMGEYPTLERIYKHCSSLPYFMDATPENHKEKKVEKGLLRNDSSPLFYKNSGGDTKDTLSKFPTGPSN